MPLSMGVRDDCATLLSLAEAEMPVQCLGSFHALLSWSDSKADMDPSAQVRVDQMLGFQLLEVNSFLDWHPAGLVGKGCLPLLHCTKVVGSLTEASRGCCSSPTASAQLPPDLRPSGWTGFV